MRTITQPISTCAALHTCMQEQSWQIREVQEAIREADNDDFATDEQVDAVFEKYGVSVRGSGETNFDQVLFNLNSDQFQQFNQILDASVAANQGLSRLMSVQVPWQIAVS